MVTHKNIMNTINKRSKKIDMDGIITNNNTRFYACYIMLIFTYVIFYIYAYNKQFTHYQFLLHETSYYSKFVEYVLILNNTPYTKIYTPYMNNISYISNDTTININPSFTDFADGDSPLIPLSEDEIEELEKHTGFKNLTKCQNKILKMSPNINAYQIINTNQHGEKIKTITPTRVNDYKWGTILSDAIQPLKTNDILNATFYDAENKSIFIEKKYLVDNTHQLVPLSGKVYPDIQQLPFYSLNDPRPELRFHPFHLPQTIDIVLTIMILTQACIDS